MRNRRNNNERPLPDPAPYSVELIKKMPTVFSGADVNLEVERMNMLTISEMSNEEAWNLDSLPITINHSQVYSTWFRYEWIVHDESLFAPYEVFAVLAGKTNTKKKYFRKTTQCPE